MNRLCLSIFIAVLTVLGCSGCSRRIPAATVVLVDPSASVTERGRKDEFAAVAALIPKMQRGDLLIVIPITDNAAADMEGRVLRLRAPEQREAYDSDLRHFRIVAGERYERFAANLLAHPGRQTDILGALDVARQELVVVSVKDKRTLIVLSDFLEDDARYRFDRDRYLGDTDRARQFAGCLAKTRGFELHSVRIHLGRLQSADFGNLGSQRQAAVGAFWSVYFSRTDEEPDIRFDGLGMLP